MRDGAGSATGGEGDALGRGGYTAPKRDVVHDVIATKIPKIANRAKIKLICRMRAAERWSLMLRFPFSFSMPAAVDHVVIDELFSGLEEIKEVLRPNFAALFGRMNLVLLTLEQQVRRIEEFARRSVRGEH